MAAACAAGSVTAYEALIAVGREKGDAFLDNLVEMRAVDGTPQPPQWILIFRDESARGGLREFVVTDKGISSERTPLRAEDSFLVAPTMPYTTLKMDSTGAFDEANRLATQSKLGFDSVSYRLSSEGNAPVWNLRLLDAGRREVGTMKFSATTGKAVSLPANSLPSSAAQEDSRPIGERWVEGGGLVGHMTRWGERTWDATTNVATGVGRSVERTWDTTTNAVTGVGRSVERFLIGSPTNAPVGTD